MQLVRVATKDPQNASLLVVHLAGLFGGEQVSLQADGEVQVQLPELNGELVQTLKAVESWLEHTGIASAEVSVNAHCTRSNILNARQRAWRPQDQIGRRDASR